MKKTNKIFILIMSLVLVLSLTACEAILIALAEGLMSVSGKAINVMASATEVEYWKGTPTGGGTEITMEGAVITLTPTDTSLTVKTATVGSDGTWLVTGIAQGTYKVTGEKDGWTFIPMEVEVNGLLQSITSDLLAYPNQGEQTILLIVKWNNPNIDVDAHLVIDDGAENYSTAHPVVKYGTPAFPTTGTAAVSLDRDVRFDGPTDTSLSSPLMLETIRIVSNPFATLSGSGWLRYYLDSYSYIANGAGVQDNGFWTDGTVTKGGTLTGNPDATDFTGRADATVYIMQGSTFFGAFPMPVDTAENTLGVIKIEVVNGSPISYTFYSFGNMPTPRGLALNVVPVAVDSIR